MSADNLCALMCAAAKTGATDSPDKRCAPNLARQILQLALPRVLLAIVSLPILPQDTLIMIARSLKRP